MAMAQVGLILTRFDSHLNSSHLASSHLISSHVLSSSPLHVGTVPELHGEKIPVVVIALEWHPIVADRIPSYRNASREAEVRQVVWSAK